MDARARHHAASGPAIRGHLIMGAHGGRRLGRRSPARVLRVARRSRRRAGGPPFFRYHVIDMERQLLVEAGVPVALAVDDGGDIRGGTLPAGRFAVMTHTGAPPTLVAATSALLDWAQQRGLAFDLSGRPTRVRSGAAAGNLPDQPC